MTAVEAAAFYIGLHLIVLVVLAARVSLARTKHQVALGDGGQDSVERRIRAHGNATEFVPAALVGLGAMAGLGAPAIAIHALGGTLLVGRLLHAWGLAKGRGRTFGRFVGTILTITVYVCLAGGCIGHALF
ncbi:MAG: MAPEG family protein [Maricaulaceae bacterium]